MLAPSIEIMDIYFVDFLFLKLSIEIVDYFIPRLKENSLLNLPGSDILLTKLNNTLKYLTAYHSLLLHWVIDERL